MGLAVAIILSILGIIGFWVTTICIVVGCIFLNKYKKNKEDTKSKNIASIWFAIAIICIATVLYIGYRVIIDAANVM